jgi:hypothetical protein
VRAVLVWDEAKRMSNLVKHGLDFAEGCSVLESPYRLDVRVIRGGEVRLQSLAYSLRRGATLALVHVERDGLTRIISFRRASTVERRLYDEWLTQESGHDP